MTPIPLVLQFFTSTPVSHSPSPLLRKRHAKWWSTVGWNAQMPWWGGQVDGRKLSLPWWSYRSAGAELPFSARHCSLPYLYISSFNFITPAHWWSSFLNIHFTYEKPEAQKSKVILPDHPARRWKGQDLNSSIALPFNDWPSLNASLQKDTIADTWNVPLEHTRISTGAFQSTRSQASPPELLVSLYQSGTWKCL